MERMGWTTKHSPQTHFEQQSIAIDNNWAFAILLNPSMTLVKYVKEYFGLHWGGKVDMISIAIIHDHSLDMCIKGCEARKVVKNILLMKKTVTKWCNYFFFVKLYKLDSHNLRVSGQFFSPEKSHSTNCNVHSITL